MGITLTHLRREVGQDIGECIVGTVDAASTTSIRDNALMDLDANATAFDHAWIRCYWKDSGGLLYDETRRVRVTDEERGVLGYDPATGTVHVSRAWIHVIPIGSEYEIHKLIDPIQFDRLLLNAVQRCQYIDVIAIPSTSRQTSYDLSAYTWLTAPAQIIRVSYSRASAGNTTDDYKALRWWQVIISAGGGLEVRIRDTLSAGTLYIHVIRPHGDALGTDSGEEIDERWAKTAALNEVYRYLMHNGPAQDVDRYIRLARVYAAAFTEQSRPRVPRERAIPRHPDIQGA